MTDVIESKPPNQYRVQGATCLEEKSKDWKANFARDPSLDDDANARNVTERDWDPYAEIFLARALVCLCVREASGVVLKDEWEDEPRRRRLSSDDARVVRDDGGLRRVVRGDDGERVHALQRGERRGAESGGNGERKRG